MSAFEQIGAGRRIELLSPFVMDEKKAKLVEALEKRTRRLTLILENVHHENNASAIMRTCECFGLQDLAVVENCNAFRHNEDIDRGASKWLSIRRYGQKAFNTPEAYADLRRQGYTIYAASPHPGHDISLFDIDVSQGPIAIVFGAEKTGLSEWAMENADARMAIPMCGLTESFNVSVSAAITVSHLRRQIDQHLPNEERSLSADEKQELLAQWLLMCIRDGRGVIERILQNVAAR